VESEAGREDELVRGIVDQRVFEAGGKVHPAVHIQNGGVDVEVAVLRRDEPRRSCSVAELQRVQRGVAATGDEVVDRVIGKDRADLRADHRIFKEDGFVTGAMVFAFQSAAALVRGQNLNSKLQVACVGVNGMGFSDLKNVGTHAAVKFVGFCDVDANRFDQADNAHPGVKHFADYREMFATLGDGFDAVTVGIPDHMHAPVAVAAMQRGKHVYCQKPLAPHGVGGTPDAPRSREKPRS
jgi:hypothetical protein